MAPLELSERLSDAISRQRRSEHSRGCATMKEDKEGPLFHSQKSPKKETLGKACLLWLVMLYSEGGRLKG
jgi:hypothetical protein